MAGPYYVRSTDGDDASDGLSWANAKLTLVGAAALAAAGETVYVSQAHAESQVGAMTIFWNGAATAPVYVICVNDGAEPPTALATTATVTIAAAQSMSITGFAYIYGISFRAGNMANNASLSIGTSTPGGIIFDTCDLRSGNNSANRINLGPSASTSNDDQYVELINTTVQFAHASSAIVPRNCRLKWRNKTASVAVVAGTLPNVLFIPSAASIFVAEIDGLDLSNLGAGKTLVNFAAATPGRIRFTNCKLDSAVAVITGTNPGTGGTEVLLENCDGADTNYFFARSDFQGSVTVATNCHLSAAFSQKMVSLATGPTLVSPLISLPIAKWNTSTGSALTATIEIIHDSATALKDDEVWVELVYLGTSGFPLGSYVDDRRTWFGTPANQTASTAAWTEDLANENKQKLVVTFTPQEAGYVIARVKLGKVNYTVYVDPEITIAAA